MTLTLKPIELTASVQGWSTFKRRSHDAAFAKVAENVFKRDNHTCQFCGFRAEKMQEVINLDQNYRNNRLENLVTACAICTRCFFLGAEKNGKIIFLPEYSQADLNNFVRVLLSIMEVDNQYAEKAKSLYRALRNRHQKVDEILGQDASEADIFGQTLIDLETVELPAKKEVLAALRYLPNRNPLLKHIKYWSTIIMPKLEPDLVLTKMV